MSDYISRNAAIELGYWHGEKPTVDNPFPDGVDAVDIVDIENLPAADVREVVTCEECVWHADYGYHYCNKWCVPCHDNAEFFCAYGERPNCGVPMEVDE